MNDATTGKMVGIALGICHVVPMRQEDVGDPAESLELVDERSDELRRVDQPVASGMLDEVAVAAIGLGRIVATIEDWLFDEQRKVLHHRLHIIVTEATNGPCGAGKQRL